MSIQVLFSFLALVLSIVISIYLFVEWLRHRRRPRFLLLWALALFLMYWFQLPVILIHFGQTIIVTDFNLFFTLTFPITFLALMLIYLGTLEALNFHLKRKIKILLFSWFLLSILFFAYQFILNEGVIKTYSLPLISNIVFYLPIRMLIILAIVRWFSQVKTRSIFGTLGAVAIMGESVLGIARNFLILKNVLAYPPWAWYLILSSLEIFFILQTLGVILVALGFYWLHRMHFRK